MNAETLKAWKDRAAAWDGSGEKIAVGAESLLELLDACGRQPPEDLAEVCLVPAKELLKMVRAAKVAEPEAEVSTLPTGKRDDAKKDEDAKA